ncbi:MAG: diphthine--ammonia ligase [Desulfurococcales archaeon]|nr:diphthine--ammonia ligase [Desulfurococcales archaeon]
MTPKACALVSSGKDSNYALLWAASHGFNVECTITFHPRNRESWMLQTINTELAALQSRAMGLRNLSYIVSGEKEIEVEEIKSALRDAAEKFGFDYLVVGALRSDYQRLRLEVVGEEIGVKLVSPAWWCNQEVYLRVLVDSGVEFVLTRVAAYGLKTGFLGRVVDEDMVDNIILLSRKFGFNPAFEGGEAETLAVYTPLYRNRLCFDADIVRMGDVAELRFNRVWLDRVDTPVEQCYLVNSLS